MTLTNLTNDLVGKKVLVKVNTETGSDVNGYWYRATVTQVHLRRGKATSASVQLDHEAGLAARCQVWREINGLRQTQSTSSERRSKAIDNKIEALLEKAAHSKTNQMSTYRVGSKQMIVLSDQVCPSIDEMFKDIIDRLQGQKQVDEVDSGDDDESADDDINEDDVIDDINDDQLDVADEDDKNNDVADSDPLLDNSDHDQDDDDDSNDDQLYDIFDDDDDDNNDANQIVNLFTKAMSDLDALENDGGAKHSNLCLYCQCLP
ncbi:hypothetical protein SAMD00019534_054080 [Acytostelium subglobosum LB1]|uniref:hypothetical protein n=1 Tax=Acytostelium subglobosum LB1 TaxID=1410327 RepID=UPI0006448BF4|nr:hypothetical protein SAMD00019534_054080 [Acytostelium subglobosum LB1]GAM22233.1 hypothetical protein SAMD00019534_054080 [Acytostelium subglobosum LB1]|eukprot:XP_012754353.1 hypothetical protein SAMD00019534_054080 [Acytostelium subglobosum LB1]